MPDEAPTPDTPPTPTPTNPDIEPPDSLEARLQAAEAAAREAVVKYREARLAASPDLPDELVGGTTIAEVDASLERARRIVEAIRAAFERHRTSGGTALPANVTPFVPAGGSVRSASSAGPNAWASLPASDRIRAALAR
jgi:hypothetical protein